jgi:hypothetical protein
MAMPPVSAFAAEWRRLEAAGHQPPQRVRLLRRVSRETFEHGVLYPDAAFVAWLIGSLAAGDVVIVRRMFEPAFMARLRTDVMAWTAARPPAFYKMLEGSPDFHRIIDPEAGRNYAFAGCKHSAYFYRWNDDPLEVWPAVTPAWRLAKTVMGLAPEAYEKLTPKDGVVDRVQVVRYPPAIGFLEPHQDPHLHQRLFFSGYMSKRGVDYQGGGFYLVDADDQLVEIEDLIEVGDACLGYATLWHGVAPVDRHKAPDWSAGDGRWFLSLYSNASDEPLSIPGAQRHTGHPVKLNLPGVMP